MDYRPLGRTGVQVSKLCLGTMMFGAWGNSDHDDSIRIIHAALDAGVNFVDTADVYSDGESEEIVGKALDGRRDDVVLATKFFMPMGDDPNRRGGSRRWIVRAVEESLRRLGTDWIDLYQVHRPDAAVDVDETLGALTDLVRQGKVPRRLLVVLRLGDRRGTVGGARATPGALPHRAAALLAPLDRRQLIDLARTPTASRAIRHVAARESAQARSRRAAREGGRGRRRVADRACHRFLVNHPAVTSAIIGPRTMEQLDSQITAADVVLDAARLDRIDEIVRPGVDLNPADTSYGESVLKPARRRR
jgi:aryl-alcohol dehydrogenase-like predicted oxidoreductase